MSANHLRLLVGICLAAGLLACQAPWANRAQAKIIVQEKVSYYAVKGRSGLDLGKAMVAGGAKVINLRHAIAATVSKFDFLEPKVAVENGRCIVKDVTVKLTLTYYFPKWHGKNGKSRQVRQAWDAFYQELVRHEKTHGRIARNFAGKIEAELKRLSGTVRFGCKDFGSWSNVRFNLLSRQLKAEQAAFDRREDLKTSRISRLQTTLLRAK